MIHTITALVVASLARHNQPRTNCLASKKKIPLHNSWAKVSSFNSIALWVFDAEMCASLFVFTQSFFRLYFPSFSRLNSRRRTNCVCVPSYLLAIMPNDGTWDFSLRDAVISLSASSAHSRRTNSLRRQIKWNVNQKKRAKPNNFMAIDPYIRSNNVIIIIVSPPLMHVSLLNTFVPHLRLLDSTCFTALHSLSLRPPISLPFHSLC